MSSRVFAESRRVTAAQKWGMPIRSAPKLASMLVGTQSTSLSIASVEDTYRSSGRAGLQDILERRTGAVLPFQGTGSLIFSEYHAGDRKFAVARIFREVSYPADVEHEAYIVATPKPTPKPVVILISGRGSNMRALIERSRAPAAPYRVALVLSDRAAAAGLGLAHDLGVPARTLPTGESARAFERPLADAIEQCAPALLVLAGFMRILSPDFVARYAGRIVNIHPSLLPKYPGLHTHRRVLAAQEAVHGATVHFVTAELDGGPRIIQAQVAVRPDDDEAALAARVLAQEHEIYPLAVSWYCEGRLRWCDGRAWLDDAALAEPVLYEEGRILRRP